MIWKKRNKQKTIVFENSDFSWKYSVNTFFSNLIFTFHKPLIIECYNLISENPDNHLISQKADLVLVLGSSYYYYYSNFNETMEGDFYQFMNCFDIVKMNFSSSSFNNHCMTSLEFRRFVKRKNLSYFSEIFVYLDNDHQYISFRYNQLQRVEPFLEKVRATRHLIETRHW